MELRDPALQRFIDLTQEAIAARAPVASDISEAAGRMFAALGHPAPPAGDVVREDLPALRLLPDALKLARRNGLAKMADALAAIEPRLRWYRRGPEYGPAFHDGHANAYIIGPQGVEQRHDVWIGVSLLAPNLRYPDHDHAPEEIYLSLAGGEWWNAGMDWTAPGTGGLIYNPPGILHAMRTGDDPLLAIWCLWAR